MHLNPDVQHQSSQYAAPLRQSCDIVVNDFGLLLLQLCQGARLSILNGRVQGDIPAHYTCHANAGGSVVDFFVASAGICSRACSLQVQDMTPDSDHYPVVLSLDMPMAASHLAPQVFRHPDSSMTHLELSVSKLSLQTVKGS